MSLKKRKELTNKNSLKSSAEKPKKKVRKSRGGCNSCQVKLHQDY